MSEDNTYDPDKRDLSLVTVFNKENCSAQYGYQKMDDLTVLERKKIPVVVYSNTDATPWAVMITVYDFNSFQTMTYVQQVYDSEARTPQVFQKDFSAVEGKQAIADAHRALTLLGGNPPPLDKVLGAGDIGKPKISQRRFEPRG
ncbi:MAG: hypothetical protein GC185_08505 [Alphaproteobacteria bacterium]|nr:hypothetical protein [Alphaproteobacteria bacterium]